MTARDESNEVLIIGGRQSRPRNVRAGRPALKLQDAPISFQMFATDCLDRRSETQIHKCSHATILHCAVACNHLLKVSSSSTSCSLTCIHPFTHLAHCFLLASSCLPDQYARVQASCSLSASSTPLRLGRTMEEAMNATLSSLAEAQENRWSRRVGLSGSSLLSPFFSGIGVMG